MRELGTQRLSLQHRVGAHPARRPRRGERGGLDFYDRLVDALLEAASSRWPRSIHWDLPAALDDRGGWLNRDIADWFADYAHGRVPHARRPREAVGDAQRAVGRDRRRLPARRAGARPSQPFRGADRLAQPAARARRGGAGLPRAWAGTRSASSSTSSRSIRRRTRDEDVAATRARRRLHEPAVPRSRCSSARYPDELRRDVRRRLAGLAAPRTSRSSGSRSTSSASTTTPAA